MQQQDDRGVRLRRERDGANSRNLWARLDDHGNLLIIGQDLGPATRIASSDGEYEWVQTIAAENLGRLLEMLGGSPEHEILELLAERYSGRASYELERRLGEGDVPVELWVWSG